MDTKKSKPALTDDELLAQFEDLGTDAPAVKSNRTSTAKVSATKASVSTQSEQDILAELDNLASQKPASRPATPSIRLSAAAGTGAKSQNQTSLTNAVPPLHSNDEQSTSVEEARKSSDSTRFARQVPAPVTNEDSSKLDPRPPEDTEVGARWWGGFLSTATAAVSHAQAAVKEIQKGEEAQGWVGQVKGNVGVLKGLGGDLRSLAMPTFEIIIQTIVPPISSHERLQIHITHDLSGYPTLDPLIYSVFSRVMRQVEGGDLMVVQKGKEASPRRESEQGSSSKTGGGWSDGPWWRSSDRRSINAVRGVVEGSKLARASAESYASEHFALTGGVEEAAKQATKALSETNPTRTSDIFLAIQAIQQSPSENLFGAGSSSEQDSDIVKVVEETKENDETTFAVYLHDPIHGIAFHTLSQAVSSQWLDWLDASSQGDDGPPESIAEILMTGGVDPREWVAEWTEESLTLAIGVVAQRYVAQRMGVGEGGVGKGKMKADKGAEEMVESGGGEAARAIGGL